MTVKQSGFTIIELIIVIAIISILAVIAIPNMRQWVSNSRMKDAARELQSAIQLSRITAIKENVTVVITFDIGNDSYEAFVDNGEGGGTANDGIKNGQERTIKSGGFGDRKVDLYKASFSGGVPRVRIRNTGRSGLGHAYLVNDSGYMGVVIRSVSGNSRIVSSKDGATWN